MTISCLTIIFFIFERSQHIIFILSSQTYIDKKDAKENTPFGGIIDCLILSLKTKTTRAEYISLTRSLNRILVV